MGSVSKIVPSWFTSVFKLIKSPNPILTRTLVQNVCTNPFTCWVANISGIRLLRKKAELLPTTALSFFIYIAHHIKFTAVWNKQSSTRSTWMIFFVQHSYSGGYDKHCAIKLLTPAALRLRMSCSWPTNIISLAAACWSFIFWPSVPLF